MFFSLPGGKKKFLPPPALIITNACAKRSLADTIKKHRSWLDPCEGNCLLEEMVHLKTDCQDWEKRLKRLISYGKSLALLLQVYSRSTWNFLHWRLDLARDPEQLMESTHKHMKQTLLFIRHGQTTWNVEHLLP